MFVDLENVRDFKKMFVYSKDVHNFEHKCFGNQKMHTIFQKSLCIKNVNEVE